MNGNHDNKKENHIHIKNDDNTITEVLVTVQMVPRTDTSFYGYQDIISAE